MGRLFWKFFLALWFAQILAALCTGFGFWFMSQRSGQLDTAPPHAFHLKQTALLLQHEGMESLQRYLELSEKTHAFPPIFALDSNRHELLGRAVPDEVADAVLRFPPVTASQNGVEVVGLQNGRAIYLFIPHGPGAHFPFPPREHLSQQQNLPLANPGGEERPQPVGERPEFERPFWPPLLPLGMGILVNILVAWLLAKYFSKPIKVIKDSFKVISRGDFSRKAMLSVGKRRDELVDLCRDFDGMAVQLKQMMEGQKRLLHDVSHELRSPLARLQIAIGLLRQQPENTDNSLIRIEREADRMNRLVGELLTLSRVETGFVANAGEKTSLLEILMAVSDDAAFEAEQRQCRVVLDGCSESYLVSGNAELLHRAIENVVRNAIRYSPDGASVCIEVSATDAKGVAICILDEGPGVVPSLLSAIFKPFYRGSETSGGGYGLGLAISERILAAHGGSIEASNRPEGGLCVRIELPLAD